MGSEREIGTGFAAILRALHPAKKHLAAGQDCLAEAVEAAPAELAVLAGAALDQIGFAAEPHPRFTRQPELPGDIPDTG